MMKKIILSGLLVGILFLAGCGDDSSFDARLREVVRPYLFSVVGWEFEALPQEVGHWISGVELEVEDEVKTVIDYFAYSGRIKALKSEIGLAGENGGGDGLSALEEELERLEEKKAALTGVVEDIMERQIRETLAGQGIYNPAGGTGSIFPPVKFRLEKLPSVLVVSPRDKIESMREFTLVPGLTRGEKEDIEKRVDALDVSSLVTEIGGVATYPSLVDSQSSLKYTLEVVIEEWVHQYLAFKPLGFRYVLDLTGISRDYEIATMNETLADMVSDELGAIIYEKYYAGYSGGTATGPGDGFDFDAEMRETRKTVDEYLARGEIERAEEYMEERRQYLVSNGYYIRRLNQAYFAFHGAYSDKPAFENPIGLELKELRARSDSVKTFLDTAAAMKTRQDLKAAIR